MVHNNDLDSPYKSAATTLSASNTKAAGRRLRRTRQHLGSYRHDLLVAMRVVNRIEREIMQAEWENWLCDEVAKCKALQTIADENRTQSSTGRNEQVSVQHNLVMEKDHDHFREIRVWFDGYCGSCSREQEKLLGGAIKAKTT